MRAEKIAPGMPAGIISHTERWVQSKPISGANDNVSCVIRGRFDVLLKMDSGPYAIVDLKTADRNEKHIPLYSRQLHAYAYALENPAPGALSLAPIERLGLLVFCPSRFDCAPGSQGQLAGGMDWIEVMRSDADFMELMKEVLAMLSHPCPPPSPNCEWCALYGARE